MIRMSLAEVLIGPEGVDMSLAGGSLCLPMELGVRGGHQSSFELHKAVFVQYINVCRLDQLRKIQCTNDVYLWAYL